MITPRQNHSSIPNKRTQVQRLASGFTMVEMAIVIGMISIVTAITVPIYVSNVQKAKLSEADANLGSIRTQLRIYYGQNSEYPKAPTAAKVIGASWNNMNTGALNGRYFSDSSYTYVSVEGIDFTITCETNSLLESDRTINASGMLAGGE